MRARLRHTVARHQGFRTTEVLNETKGGHPQPTQTSALVLTASSHAPGELPRPKPSPEAKRTLRSLPFRGERVFLLGDRRTKGSRGLPPGQRGAHGLTLGSPGRAHLLKRSVCAGLHASSFGLDDGTGASSGFPGGAGGK